MDFESYIIVAVGMYILMWIFSRWLKRKVDESEAEVNAVIKALTDRIHAVKEEQHGDHKYWFDAETDQFLGQGTTQDEIVEVLKERFRGHIFLINDREMLAGPDLAVYPLNQELVNLTAKSMVENHIK